MKLSTLFICDGSTSCSKCPGNKNNNKKSSDTIKRPDEDSNGRIFQEVFSFRGLGFDSPLCSARPETPGPLNQRKENKTDWDEQTKNQSARGTL